LGEERAKRSKGLIDGVNLKKMTRFEGREIKWDLK
jgi:hypothetical protein